MGLSYCDIFIHGLVIDEFLKGKLELELRIGIGKGYVPSEENDLPNLTVGTLSMDSIFNPVTNVTNIVRRLRNKIS